MISQRKPLAIAIASLALCSALPSAGLHAQEVHESVHVFSIDDLQVDFTGKTFGPGGTSSDQSAICGLEDALLYPGSPACPYDANGDSVADPQPFVDKQGVKLYPVDNTFGFHVVDFVGAEAKEQDGVYTEGWVGNISDAGEVVGIKVSNAETDTYKVKPPLGTWCQGLGGTSIKCSTEHYTVMEHVLTCNETIPYFYASEGGQQGELSIGNDTLSCGDVSLDNYADIIVDNMFSGTQLTRAEPGVQMNPNDNTTVFRDIAASSDYSITLKDDGKPLYRWGSLIKRPNDIRLYARLELPEVWKERDPGTGELVGDYPVTDAKLYVTHWITNNPNDQLRPEDLENEAATGRKPAYYEDGDNWRALYDCYEGDGDALEGVTGTPIVAGTLFKNAGFALDENDTDPYAFSSDLLGALTNAYYTTVDRDPFEWSYVNPAVAAAGTYDFQGFEYPLADPASQNLELVSGPRWRLKANKFGQDIPGLEIPKMNCSAPPYGHDNIKYEVGTPVTTVINLLDWDETEGPSPLSSSRGWVEMNDYVEEGVAPDVTTNGLPMTEDFDLAVYIKGDRKPTALFSARLVINGEGILPPVMPNVSIYKPKAPNNIFGGKESSVEVWVGLDDTSQAVGTGSVLFTGVGAEGASYLQAVEPFEELQPGDKSMVKVPFTAPYVNDTITWTMTLLINGVPVETTEPVYTEVKVK